MHIVYQIGTETIYGTGATLDAAWLDAREWAANDTRGLVAREASAELVDTVRATGGFGIVWFVDTDGTAQLRR